MESTTRRKVTTIAVASFMALALAGGSAFAGTSGSNGDNRLNNSGTNNKNGVDNKQTRGCGTDYELVEISNGYDVNDDGWVCWKEADGVDYWTDNTATVK